MQSKIINDPVYGFLTIPGQLIYQLIQDPFFQRLRRIKQLGVTDFVYPGATHSRFHHALGALNLMTHAVDILRNKGVEITENEAEALFAGILLHDIGHGPYSHSLENSIVQEISHENISFLLMKKLNQKLNGQLDLMLEIFSNQYHKKFLHQLISGQLDMDRLDYLSRDSFFTGVIEGQVGAQRIINMLNAVDNELVVEEKGIYSIEKFIIARRLMYWQVYLHKTVVAADILLINIMKRARELSAKGDTFYISKSLQYFLSHKVTIKQLEQDEISLNHFILLDDSDILFSIKEWQNASDPVLSQLSKNFMNRNLPKLILSPKNIATDLILEKRKEAEKKMNLSAQEIDYFVVTGILKNDAYRVDKYNSIKVLKKDKMVLDVAEASDNYNLKALKDTVKKYYLSFYS